MNHFHRMTSPIRLPLIIVTMVLVNWVSPAKANDTVIRQKLEYQVWSQQCTYILPGPCDYDFDLNGDGLINATDAIIIRNFPKKGHPFVMRTSISLLHAIYVRIDSRIGDDNYLPGLDLNEDYRINSRDYRMAQRFFLHAIEKEITIESRQD